ncbi:MAG: alpha/beta hydrolase [Oscillospiraceae bacterium]|nr:alpha/beta hydrolase [Oscillospiraceae bacterium]
MKMNGLLLGTGIAAGVVALAAAGSTAGAFKLFNKVIPRQDGVKVNMDEMADAKKWEEYKKRIAPKKEYLLAQPSQEMTIKSRDGLTLHGTYFPAKEPSDRIAVCFHGYTSSAMSNASFASFLHKQGINCLLVDNRAHGESEGQYIGFGVLDRYDCLSWLDFLNKQFENKARFMLYGVSMGASTALMTIGMDECPENVALVVADCGFTSPYDVFAHVLKKDYKMSEFPVMNINDVICRKKAGYGFKDCSTLDTLKKAKCPVLFVHGKDDNFVPVWMSGKNYDVCSSDKDILLIENAGHGASYFENSELYESKVSEFIDKYFK